MPPAGPIIRAARPRRRHRAGVARSTLFGAIAVLLLATAAVLWIRARGAEDQAPADEFVELRCTQCNHAFRVSHRELDRRFTAREYATNRGAALTFRCEQCGQMTAAPAGAPAGAPEQRPP